MIRIQFPGALYHIVNRGDRGEAIVHDDIDREQFLTTLTEAVAKTGWRVHAYCLLNNHFHILLETPEPNLVDGMKWFLGTYTARFNRRHASSGHLFSGRYRSQLIDPALPRAHADTVAFNPERAGLVSTGKSAGFRWSSFPAYQAGGTARPSWLSVDATFRELGLQDDESGRAGFAAWYPEKVGVSGSPDWDRLRTGWYVGGTEFRRELLDRLESQRRPSSSGVVWKASAEQQAEKLIQQRLLELGWADAELARRPKTDVSKVWIARSLRKETTMTVQWIASRLQMGTRNTLRNALLDASAEVFKIPESQEKSSAKARPVARVGEPSSASENPSVPSWADSQNAFEPGWD
jgi:putative transposase